MNFFRRALGALRDLRDNILVAYYRWRLGRIREQNEQTRIVVRHVNRAARVHGGRAYRKGKNRILHRA